MADRAVSKGKRREDEGSGLAVQVRRLAAFYTDSMRFFAECEKPNAQFVDVARSTLIGFVVIGLAGYLVKLIHIPINQILVGA